MKALEVVAQTTRQAWITAALGVLFGMLLVPLVLLSSDNVARYWDRTHPVATGTAVLLLREPDAIEYEIHVNKLRACEFVRIVPYAVAADGQRLPLNTQRLDRPERVLSHPPGPIYAGRWRAWPMDGALRVEIVISYLCGDRLNFASVGTLDLR
jgi:hypothetical protein